MKMSEKLKKIKTIASTVEYVCTNCEKQVEEEQCNLMCNAYKLLRILKIIEGAEDV